MKQSARILPVLTLLFLTSFMARAADSAVKADALFKGQQIEAEEPSVNDTFDELDEWEQGLIKREREIEAKAMASEIAMAKAEEKEKELAALEAKVASKNVSVRKLAQLYGAMETKRAASTLASLPKERSAEILLAMSPDIAGPVMAEMPLAVAQGISDIMVAME